jgi:hypothetical protein
MATSSVRDFTIETAWVCYSNIYFERQIGSSTPGITYKVTFGPLLNGPTQVGWTCECRGFAKSGSCKHIAAAKELRCGWNEGQDPGLVPVNRGPMNQSCPNCGGSARSMRVAT